MRILLPMLCLLSCSATDEKPAEPSSVEPEDTDASETATDTSDDTSTDTSEDTSDDTPQDTGDDTSEPEACTLGLQVEINNQIIQSGEIQAFASVPSLTDTIEIELMMSNPCQVDLRFLGFPDDWIEGQGFQIGTLPPIVISPLETVTMTLEFNPGEQGNYSGTFSLPYDQPSAPFTIDLSAEVTAPLRIVLVGDGISAMTDDYGQTIHEERFTDEVHSNEGRRGVCWGFGQFVATGGSDERRMWISPDGISWTEINQGGGWIADCAYGNGMVVAAGGFHSLSSTTDLVAWDMGGNYALPHFRSVAYGDGVFVATGGTDVGVSSDGSTWDIETLHGAIYTGDITFGNGIFVSVGWDGAVVSSSDFGQTWSSTTVGTEGWSSVLYGNGIFYIGNTYSMYQSTDGINWQFINSTGGIIPRAIIGNTIFGTSSSAFYRSNDLGFSWEELATLTYGGNFNDATVEGF